MTVNDWLILGGYLITVLTAVMIAVQKLNTAIITAKNAERTSSTLNDDVTDVGVKLAEHSIELLHLKRVIDNDARLARLENHSFNL
jgi:hypothetical protein